MTNSSLIHNCSSVRINSRGFLNSEWESEIETRLNPRSTDDYVCTKFNFELTGNFGCIN